MGRGLLKKYLLAILGVGVISLGVVLGVVWFIGNDALQGIIGSGFKELADVTSDNIDSQIRNHVEIAKLLASSSAVVSAVAESNEFYEGKPLDIKKRIAEIEDRWVKAAGVNAYLLEMMSNRATLYLKRNFNRQNSGEQHHNIIIVVNERGAAIAATSRPENYYYGDARWWRAAFNNGAGKAFISDIAKNDKMGGNVFGIAVPVMSKSMAIGVLYMVHDVDAFFKAVTLAKVGTTDHTMLINEEGKVLFCPESPADEHEIHKEALSGFVQNSSGWLVGMHDVHFPGRKAVSGFAPVTVSMAYGRDSFGGKKWYVITSQDPKETFATVDKMLNFITLVSVVGIALVLVLGWFATDKLLRPIKVLIRGAELIGGGDLDHRINVKTGDELQDLALKINDMALKLKIFYIKLDEKVKERTVKLEHRNKELDLLYTMTSALNTSIDLQKLIDNTIKTMHKIMNADHVVFWLAEEGGKRGRIVGSMGIDASDLKKDSMAKMIEMVAGDICADNSKLWQSENVTVDDRLEEIGYKDQTYLSIVGIPAVSQNRTIGAILLLYKHIYALTPWEENVVTPLGQQIGIAVEHSMLFEKKNADS